MKAGSAAAALLTVIVMMAGAPATLHAQTVAAGFFAPAPPPAPINSLAFAVRAPLPGQPGYLGTIKFIDDGMRYVDPLSLFYVSPAGEICFRIRPNYPTTIYETYYRDWCIFPQTVDRVEVVTNPTINEVRLWCMRAYPQCAHSPADGGFANYIVAPTLDYRQERVAVENLVYMMGGNSRFAEPREAFR